MDTRAAKEHASAQCAQFDRHRAQSADAGEVRAAEEGRELAAVTDRAKREVLNYFAGLRLHRIRQYVLDNPNRWAVDRENPGDNRA